MMKVTTWKKNENIFWRRIKYINEISRSHYIEHVSLLPSVDVLKMRMIMTMITWIDGDDDVDADVDVDVNNESNNVCSVVDWLFTNIFFPSSLPMPK